jgi:hypothetical protein
MAASKRNSPAPAEEELQRLYLQPPECFTKTRDELARGLRERGERDAAQQVKKLRRPSLAAWLVNQLALREPDALEALLAAGQRLRDAEDAMLAGKGDPAGLRAAAADEREAIASLIDAARGIASSDGRELNPATLDRVAETLQAAGADAELAERVRAGRIDKEVRAATIGASTRVPVSAQKAKADDSAADARAERERARVELDGARRDLERAEQRRDRAQDDVEKQTVRLKQARAELADAKRDVKRLEATVKRAEQRAGKKR